jgi:UDP-glucuronate decarboxylase
VVSNFIVQALRGEPITIYGDGSQTRSFCYVSDLIDGFVRLMESPPEVTGPINLGNPVEFSIRELAEMILAEIGGPSRIVARPLPSDDPRQRKPDIERAREVLGWQPKVALAEGLRATIGYFDQALRRPGELAATGD